MTDVTMRQEAPYPIALLELVMACEYRPGWLVSLSSPAYDRGQGSVGLTLIITTKTVNSYDHDQPVRVAHLFPVPPAAYDRDSWQRWLLEQFLLVERHEACEFFTVAGVKPYAPNHGEGRDPYVIHDYATEEQAATTFRNEPAGKGRGEVNITIDSHGESTTEAFNRGVAVGMRRGAAGGGGGRMRA